MQHLTFIASLIAPAEASARRADKIVSDIHYDLEDARFNEGSLTLMEIEEELEDAQYTSHRRHFAVAALYAAYTASMDSFMHAEIDTVIPIDALNKIISSYV